MMNREVRTIMDKHPVTVHPDLTVEELSKVMLSRRIQQIPVVEDGKFVGLITSYDLWRRAEHKSPNETTIGNLKVRDVMTRNVIKISPKDKAGTAAELFADRRFKTLPVVNLRDELKGMITAFDIIKIVFNDEYSKNILFKEEFTV
ncbi:MAG: CBS domain-containing protein [Saprospiraceae bacterium]|nr:CBS domain-containing protein [Saprospiraceae bacterium]